MGSMTRTKNTTTSAKVKTRKKSITNQSAKAKGRALQKWACERISHLTGLPWGPDECIASREASQHGTDVRLVGPARTLFPYSVECKWQETWDVPGWIRQARANQQPDTDWLLIAKRSRVEPIVVMEASHFFDLMAELREARGDN